MQVVVKNKIHEYRTNKKITQEELALAVGVTRQTVISIEKGNYTPSVSLAIILANFFGVAVEELFSIKYEK